ncbi:nucleoside diphosphate kinase 2, chloroplastic-like isoform X2 [Aristolochia californica]|uniref:nucleoside diphosphate kinase 2, chloroplastic-like isoform X2 n=1 Tax=Aristolochia californica TaxID=171875 RepID=UPI0035DCD295
METLAVCGRSPCVSNKLFSVAESNGSSSYAQTLCLATQHLSAFNASSLRCFTPPRCYAKLRHRSSKPHIFLPHLVASMETVEETYIMIKPDGVQRGLEHYRDLKSKPFFPKLIDYITSGPVVCMVWEGVGVVASARKIIGVTNPLQAEPGTIRGDLAVQTGRNVVHGSDSPENGQREISLWFKEGEVCQWTPTIGPWLRE